MFDIKYQIFEITKISRQPDLKGNGWMWNSNSSSNVLIYRHRNTNPTDNGHQCVFTLHNNIDDKMHLVSSKSKTSTSTSAVPCYKYLYFRVLALCRCRASLAWPVWYCGNVSVRHFNMACWRIQDMEINVVNTTAYMILLSCKSISKDNIQMYHLTNRYII